MKARLFILLFLSLGLVFGWQSCRKTETATPDAETTSAEDNAYADKTFDDAQDAMNEQAYPHSSIYKNENALLTACATVTLDSLASPYKLTIDFGTGCQGRDGRMRSGKIITTFTGRYRDSGSVMTITFDNYYVDSNKVEGTKTITNMGHNAAGNMHFKIEVTGAKITLKKGGTITWQSSRDREWTQGSSTPRDISDDEYVITGNASGVNRFGNNFSVRITKGLVVHAGCPWIESGVVEVIPAGKSSRTIDFGSGTCDRAAVVTIAGKNYTVYMR